MKTPFGEPRVADGLSGGERREPGDSRDVVGSRISVITPTLDRPSEVQGLLENLSGQTILPWELILVDASPDDRTRDSIERCVSGLPFGCSVVSRGGGTAVQRNVGLDLAQGDFFAFVDDDIRLDPDFFEQCLDAFSHDGPGDRPLGGVSGYITNQHLDPESSPRWRLYRRLKVFGTYEPGRYDLASGYPINRYLQPPHDAIREIDFMGAGCAVWRREVFEDGLRFSDFFVGHGVLEDAHLALRAASKWRLAEVGAARCIHLRSPGGRDDGREVGFKSAVNYRFVFKDVVPLRSWRQESRFWIVQFLDLARFVVHGVRHPSRSSISVVEGKLRGIWHALWM